jgi:hypothetical protein
MCDFVQASLLEIVPNLAAVDAVFGGMDTEDLTEKFQRALAIALVVGEDFAHVEVTLGGEAARIEKDIARNRNAHDGAPDIDVGKIERLPVERYEPLRPDLADIRPEIGKHLALIGLAIGAGPVEFEPVYANADDPSGAGVQPEGFENLLPVLIGGDVQKYLSSPRGNTVRILSNRFDVDYKCCWLSHAHSLRTPRTGQGRPTRFPKTGIQAAAGVQWGP